jgi:hypothetical protein
VTTLGFGVATPPAERPLLRLSALLVVHDRTEDLFLQHQELLIERRLPEAVSRLRDYRALVELHMRHEEELLLPVYLRSEPSKRWPAVLYTGQHQRMRELLSGIDARLAALGDNVRSRDIIGLLDYERTYKHLVEHHDGAEREGFFPALDRIAGDPEQDALARRCLDEWYELERSLGGRI